MTADLPYPILAGIFLAVLLLVEGVWLAAGDWRARRRGANRRLRMLSRGTGESVLATLRRADKPDGGGLAVLDRMIQRAGLVIPTPRFLAILLALTMALTAAMAVLTGLPPWQAVPLAAVAGGVLPLLWLKMRAKARLRRLGGQLPDAIDMIVRSLRAGHPISAAIGTVARETADPIGTEFGIVFDEMTYGLDLREALENLGRRVPVPDLNFLLVAVRVQYATGGNLAEVLAGLSRVVRERLRMRHRVQALSAEGRMSAAILSVLPFVLGGLIFAMRPKYFLGAASDPAFESLMVSGLAGIALGIVVMNRIVNFRF